SEHFQGLTPESNQQNPWFGEFWEDHFQCILPQNKIKYKDKNVTLCNGSLSLGSGKDKSMSPSLHFVRDSVYAFAKTFDKIHKELCKGKPGICSSMQEELWGGTKLVQWL